MQWHTPYTQASDLKTAAVNTKQYVLFFSIISAAYKHWGVRWGHCWGVCEEPDLSKAEWQLCLSLLFISLFVIWCTMTAAELFMIRFTQTHSFIHANTDWYSRWGHETSLHLFDCTVFPSSLWQTNPQLCDCAGKLEGGGISLWPPPPHPHQDP